MQLAADRLPGHLQKDLRAVYTVWGDEPLLAQEACDAIRTAARAAGCSERQVHTVAGAHFDWSSLLGAAQALSLFADRQLVEIRIPSGKPGKDGSEALQRYCDMAIEGGGRDVITLVQLPRLDRSQQSSAWFAALDRAGLTVRVDPVERGALPQWIAARLARAGPARRLGQRRPAHARLLRRPRRGQPARRAPGDPEAGAALSGRRARLRADRERRCSTSPATTSSGSARRCSRARPRARCACSTACATKARRRCSCTGRWPRTSAA